MKSKRNRLTEIYSDYYPVVFNAVYSKLGDRDDAMDICHEVFIRLYRKLDEVENIRKWLFTAIKLVILEHYRKKKGENSLNIDDVFNDLSLTFVNGFRDARIIISDAMDNIENFKDEKERVLFDLIAVSNYTYEHTAKILGMTRRQVEYRYGIIIDRILNYLA